MIVELFVKGFGSVYTRLDTYGNENIALTFQIDDIRDIANKNASYSKDFNLPATKINNEFFNHFYDLDRYHNAGNPLRTFNPYVNRKAYLQVDGITVLEGYVKLNKTLEKQTEISYSVTLFNDVASLIDILGDATLSEIDWSYLNHERSWNNVYASFDGLDTAGNEVDYTYQLINDGQIGYQQAYDKYKNYILCVKLKAVIDKIFQYAGFTYESSLFDTVGFKKLYIDTGSNPVNVSNPARNIFYPEGNGGQLIGDAGFSQAGRQLGDVWQPPVPLIYTTVTGDPDNMAHPTAGKITLPYDAQVFISSSIGYWCYDAGYVDPNGNYIGGQASFSVFKNGVEVYQQWTPYWARYFDINTGQFEAGKTNILNTFSLFADENDVIEVKFKDNSPPDNTIFMAPIGVASKGVLDAPPFVYGQGGQDTDLRFQVYPSTPSGIVDAAFTKIKMADVIKDVITMFNLNVEQKGANTILFQPYADFISNDIVDWTKKVDYNEEQVEVIEVPKTLSFKFAEDKKDYYHELYEESNGIRYGDFKLDYNTDSLEEKVIQLKVFAAPVIRTINNTDLTVQHIGTLNNDDTIVGFKNKPRIVHRVGNPQAIPLSTSVLVATNDAAWTNSRYNPMTHFNQQASNVTNASFSYLFGLINPVAITDLNVQTPRNLFSEYWFSYVNDRYNEDAVLLKLKAKLTPTDILQLDFSKIYQIESQHYRLNKVNYNTDRNKLSTIELIRI